MAIPQFYEILRDPEFQNADVARQKEINENYWKLYEKENPGDKWAKAQAADARLALGAKEELASASPVARRALELQRDVANMNIGARNEDRAGGWSSPEERNSYITTEQAEIEERKAALKKTYSLFDPEVDKQMQPAWEALQKTASASGYFGGDTQTLRGPDGEILAGSAETLKNRQAYEGYRDTLAKDFNLAPEEVDDLVKHRMGLQEKAISRDAAGGLHIKDELLVKGNQDIQAAIAESDLPDSVKSDLSIEAPQRLSLFKASVVDNVKSQHPELASEIKWTGNVEKDYAALTDVLNKSRAEQFGGGVAASFGKRVATFSNATDPTGVPYVPTGTDFLDDPVKRKELSQAAVKKQESVNQLSSFINGEKTKLLGVDAATIGAGVYSGVESVGIGAVTGGLGTAVISADRIKKAGTVGKILLGGAQRGLNTAPIAAIYGTEQGLETYERTGDVGLSLLSAAIEGGVTTAFGAVKLGGTEDLGQRLANGATRQQVTKSVGKAWRDLGVDVTKTITGEQLEELTITALNNLYVESRLNPGMTVADLKKNLLDTSVATLFASGPLGAITGVAEQGGNLLKPTYDQDTDALRALSDKKYKAAAQENLPEAEAAGGAFPASGPVSLAEIERERATQIADEQTTDEERAILEKATPEDLAEGWGVDLTAEESIQNKQQDSQSLQSSLDTLWEKVSTEKKALSSNDAFELANTAPIDVWVEDGNGGRAKIVSKKTGKTGTQTIEFVSEYFNEETGEWEPNPFAYKAVSKKADGSTYGDLPQAWKPGSYTDLEGNVVATAPRVAKESLPENQAAGGTKQAPSSEGVASVVQMTRQELQEAIEERKAEATEEDAAALQGTPEEVAARYGVEIVEDQQDEQNQQSPTGEPNAPQTLQLPTVPTVETTPAGPVETGGSEEAVGPAAAEAKTAIESDVQRVVESSRADDVDLRVDVSPSNIQLRGIEVPKTEQRKGKATRAISALKGVAERSGLPISLTVEPSADMSKATLVNWYSKQGFVLQEDGESMIYTPPPATNISPGQSAQYQGESVVVEDIVDADTILISLPDGTKLTVNERDLTSPTPKVEPTASLPKAAAAAGISGSNLLNAPIEDIARAALENPNDVNAALLVFAAAGTRPASLPDQKQEPKVDAKGQLQLFQEEEGRFTELTKDLPAKPTAADLDAWRASHPDEYRELKEMRERVLRGAGYDSDKFLHGSPQTELTAFRGPIYLTRSRRTAGDYARTRAGEGRVYEFLVKLGNRLNLFDYRSWVDLVETLDAQGKDTTELKNAIIKNAYPENFGPLGSAKTWENFSDRLRGLHKEDFFLWDVDGNELSATFREDTSGFMALDQADRVRAIFNLGFDSITQPEGGYTEEEGSSTIVRSPEQIKSTEPLNTDADGNLIPPSQWGDTSSPSILFQSSEQPKGTYTPKAAAKAAGVAKATLGLLEGKSDASTGIHEAGHAVEDFLEEIGEGDKAEALRTWAKENGKTEWREQREFIARGFERFVVNGVKTGVEAVDRAFARIAEIMLNIYKGVKGSSIDIDIPPHIEKIFNDLLSRGAELEAAGKKPVTLPVDVVKSTPSQTKKNDKPDAPKKKPTRKLPPKLFGPRRAIEDSLRKAYDLAAFDAKPQGFTEQQLAEDALADIAEAKAYDEMTLEQKRKTKAPPITGEDLVGYLLENLDLRADPRQTMLLTYEQVKTSKELDSLRAKMEKDPDPATASLIDTKREYLKRVLDVLAVRGSLAGSSLRAYRNVVNHQFEPEIMALDYLGWKNSGRPKSEWVPVTAEERNSIEKESKRIRELEKELEAVEADERIQAQIIEAQEYEIAQLKAQLAKKSKPTTERKPPSANVLRDRLAALGYEKKTTLEQRGDTSSPSILYQLPELPKEALAVFADLVASLRAEGKTDKQIQNELGAYGVTEHAERIFSAAAPRGPRSPEQLAKEIDPDKELSPRMIYNMAGGFLRMGHRGRAVLEKVLEVVQTERPETTLLEVLDAYTGYGKPKFPSKEEIARLNRKLRRLELVNRQIGELEAGRLPKLTGPQRDRLDPTDEEDRKIQKLVQERNQLMRDLKISDASIREDQMRTALSAMKTRVKSDIAEMDEASKTRTALVKKAKRDPNTDEELVDLKRQRKAKRAEYNAAFGIDARQLSMEQRLAAAERVLDREIKIEEDLALKGLLERKKPEPLQKTPAMLIKAKRLAELKRKRLDEKRALVRAAKEILNPPKTKEQRQTESLEKQTQKAIDRLEYYLKNGKMPTSDKEGVTYSRETFPVELFNIKSELEEAVAYLKAQKRKAGSTQTAQLNRQIRQLEAARNALEKDIQKKEWQRITEAPVPAKGEEGFDTKAERERISSLKETIKILRDVKEKAQKADPVWQAVREYNIDESLTKAANKRRDKYNYMLENGIFVEEAKIKHTPSRKLEKARYAADMAKKAWLEKRHKYNYENSRLSTKVVKAREALWDVMSVLTLGLDIAFGRQGLIPALLNPKLASVWVKVLKESTEEMEYSLYQRLNDPQQSPVTFYMQKFKNKQYKLYSPHETLKIGVEDIPRPELLKALDDFIRQNPSLKRIPGLAPLLSSPTGLLLRLERANRMAHNIMADSIAGEMLGKRGLAGIHEITASDVELAANASMVAVRRGSFRNEQLERGFPLINVFLISGRYLVSGIQYATFQPLWTAKGGYRGTMKMRANVAWNLYGRVLTSASVVATVLGWAAYGDDEEKWKRYINPLDNRFMILEFNGVEYNFLKALTPYVSILAKLIMGYKVTDGKVVKLRGEGAQWGRTAEDEIETFLQNRKSLRAGLIADVFKGKHYDDSDVTAWSVLKKAFTNINIQTDLKLLENEQISPIQKAVSVVTLHSGLDTQLTRAKKEKEAKKKQTPKLKRPVQY